MSALAAFSLPGPVRRTLRALAPVVLTEEVEELGIADEVVDGVELFLRSIPAPLRVGIVAGVVTFEQSARAASGSGGRGFSRLARPAARAHFERWWGSRLGVLHQLARALKMFLTFSYYEHPAVRARIGYDPERWIAKVKDERARRFGDAARAHDELVLAPDPLVPAPGSRRPAGEPRTGRETGVGASEVGASAGSSA